MPSYISPQFTPGLIWRLAQIVPEATVEGDLLLFLPPLENFFPSAVVGIRRRDVPDPFVVAPMVVETTGLSYIQFQPRRKAQIAATFSATWAKGFSGKPRKLLKEMVGPRGLEPQTSTVSIL